MDLSPLETSLRRNWGRVLSSGYSQYYGNYGDTSNHIIRVLGGTIYVQNSAMVIASRNVHAAPDGMYMLNELGGLVPCEQPDPWKPMPDPARLQLPLHRLQFAPVHLDMTTIMNMSVWIRQASQAKGDVIFDGGDLTVTGYHSRNSVNDTGLEPFAMPEGFVFPGGEFATRVAANLLAIALHDCKRQSDPTGAADGYVLLATHVGGDGKVKTVYLFNVGGWQSSRHEDLTPTWESYTAMQPGVTFR